MTTTTHPCDRRVPPSGLMRWCRFNLVGGIGILVQFAVLFLLKSVMQFNYLAATVIAVEASPGDDVRAGATLFALEHGLIRPD